MPLGGNGRTPIDINFFKEAVDKSEKKNLTWRETYGWLPPLYINLQKELAATNLPKVDRRIPDLRSLKPFPRTGNEFYGWVATNPAFRLEIYGPDIMGFPLDVPKFEDDL